MLYPQKSLKDLFFAGKLTHEKESNMDARSRKKNLSDTVREKTVFLSEQWYFTPRSGAELFEKVPAKSKRFRIGANHEIDLDIVAGKQGAEFDECTVYNRFELQDAQDLGFSAGASYWFEARLNGETIFSSFPNGNRMFPPSANDHCFTGKGRKGCNLLSVRVRRGSSSEWTFCIKEKNFAAADPSMPIAITADRGTAANRIKPMNAVNNGPIQGANGRGNMELWKNAEIPYVRNHDASFCASYGGEHTVDIRAVFPDFDKDPNDPASYDFTLTDWYLKKIQDAGSRVFYRLGSKIEHAPKKYGTCVPPDFKKWAVVCEHIIRHYNEGWADGFKWDIRYWEIWNEPDLRKNNASASWQGTEEQFFELYRTAATHLKKCFPKLKIGGPAVCYVAGTWPQRFLAAMTAKKKRVPMDFFSFHSYTPDPKTVESFIRTARRMLDEAGYTETECILDEWNYVHGWTGEAYKYTIRSIIGIKGAAYAAAVMCIGQNAPLDMLMYYDARPTTWNGLFGYYYFEPLKTYFVFLIWAKLVKLGKQITVDTQDKNGIYAVGATDGKKTGVLISRFFEQENLPDELPVTFRLKKGDLRGAKLYLIDESHDLAEIPYRTDPDGNLLFTMKANTIVYLEK